MPKCENCDWWMKQSRNNFICSWELGWYWRRCCRFADTWPPPQCLAMNTQMHEILIIIKIWYLLLISVGKEITSNCWWILIASVYFFLYFVTNINLQLIFNLLRKIISALIIFYMMNDCYAQSHSDCFPRLVCFYIHLVLIFFSSYRSGCNVTNIWRQSRNPATETL